MSLNMLMWLTMLTLFAGILYLAAAVFMALTPVLPAAIAALLSGVALLAVCVLLAVAIRAVTRPPAEDPAPRPADAPADNPAERDPAPIDGDRAIAWARNNSDLLTAGALATGIALAASPGLRRFALRTAKPVVARKLRDTLQDVVDR